GIDELKLKKPGGLKSSITDEDREIILSALFNDPHIFGYIRNTWSLRSLAKCLTNEIGLPISFKHLQRITKDLGDRCKRPKLELLHGEDYEERKQRIENYKVKSLILYQLLITKVTDILDNKSFSYAISSHTYEASLPSVICGS
ncbi:MAG: hypothetical protein WA667_18350, partial [Candidatus Nitrosopolaris sp.]